MKSKILSALREAPGYVSGQELCDELQVSRTAVWKVINQLKEEGYVIESVPRKGYRLVSHPDSITAEEVKSRMTKELSDWKIVYYDEIDSTNNEAKRFAENGETQKALFIAEQQSGGKGRRGRTWDHTARQCDRDEPAASSAGNCPGSRFYGDTCDGTCGDEGVPGILQS